MSEKTTAAAKAKPAEAEGPKPGQFVKEKEAPSSPALAEAAFMTSNEYKAPHCWACPAAGTPYAEILKPEYWANIKKLPINAHIHVDSEDGSYYAELKLLKVAQGYAIVMPLRHVVLDRAGSAPVVADGFDVQFLGPIKMFRVVRLKDGHVLKDGLATEDAARDWLRDHKRMLAA